MEKILIIQLSRLGDLVQTVPLLTRLKEKFHDCHISVLCLTEFCAIVRGLPCVDRLIQIPQGSIPVERGEEKRFFADAVNNVVDLPELKESYNLVINLTHSLFSSRICAAVTGKNKLGRITSYEGEIKALGNWTKYLFAISRQRKENLFNISDIYVGIGEAKHAPAEHILTVVETADENARKLLQDNGDSGKGRLVGFQLGANRRHRAWPVERFVMLSEVLSKLFPVEIVLLGTEKEKPLADVFCRKSNIPVINLMGKTRIRDLCAILSRCHLLISHDTGTIHVAAAVGTKTLGLYFSTAHFADTAPYGNGHTVIQAEMPCSPCREAEICEQVFCKDCIGVEMVGAVAQKILEGAPSFEGLETEYVKIYSSTFLSNGMLGYLPASCSHIPDTYLTSALLRHMWEAFLGVGNGTSLLQALSLGPAQQNRIVDKARGYLDALDILGIYYKQGIEAANSIRAEFGRAIPNRRRILRKVDELNRIEGRIAMLDRLPGQIRDFHNMMMMDMEYVQFPELADEYVKKYQQLERWVHTCGSALEQIS